MAQHSSTAQKLAFPQPPQSPRDPQADEIREGSSVNPLGEGERQHSLGQERAEWSCCRTKYSPNQSQALASSPSLMEPFQYHD